MVRRAAIFPLSFFFNDTATTEIYTLSLHDALPIWTARWRSPRLAPGLRDVYRRPRSEEHTSELQSRVDLVCRLLLEKKKVLGCYATNNRACWSSPDFKSRISIV